MRDKGGGGESKRKGGEERTIGVKTERERRDGNGVGRDKVNRVGRKKKGRKERE